jgi:hypothetical protein
VENCGNLERLGFAVFSRNRARLAASSAESRFAEVGEFVACSACAGDYEDPDRTAWPPEEEASDERELDLERGFSEEKFPAERS